MFLTNTNTHYGDVIMIASQITSLTIVYSTVYSADADQRKHQSSASLAFVRGIHRGPVNSPHKWPVTRKMFPFDDVIMCRYLQEKGRYQYLKDRKQHIPEQKFTYPITSSMEYGWKVSIGRHRHGISFPSDL